MKNNWTIIKFGGSILSPDPDKADTKRFPEYSIPFDYDFSISFLKLLKVSQDKNLIDKVIVIVGGGYLNKSYLKTTLNYIEKEKDLSQVSDDLKDLIGSASIALNAHIFLALATGLLGEENVYQDTLKYSDYDRLNDINIKKYNSLVIAAACGAGHSSDTNAMNIAKAFRVKKVISLKNVDGVYDSDPDENPKAKKYDKLNWKEYKEILGGAEYEPRSHFPVDVIATDLADKSNTDFLIMDGRDLGNFEEYLTKKDFIGTIITNK